MHTKNDIKPHMNPIDLEYNIDLILKNIFKDITTRNIDGLKERIRKAEEYIMVNSGPYEHGKILNAWGAYYNYLDNYLESLVNYKNALKIFESIHKTKETLKCLNNIGVLYSITDNEDIALEYYFKALEIMSKERVFMSIKLSVLNNIGNIYYDWEDYEKALKIYVEAYDIAVEEEIKNILPLLTFNIATGYFFIGDIKKAQKYNDICYKTAKEVHSNYDILCADLVAATISYYEDKNYQVYESTYNTLIAEMSTISSIEDQIVIIEWIGRAMISTKDYVKARKVLEELYPLLIENNMMSTANKIQVILKGIYIIQEDYKAAFYMSSSKHIAETSNAKKQMITKNYENLREQENVGNLKNSLRIFKMLASIGQGITLDMDIEHIFEYIVSQIYKIWELDVFGLALINETGQELDYYYHTKESEIHVYKDYMNDETIAMNYCVNNAKDIVIHDTLFINDYAAGFSKEMVRELYDAEVSSLLYLPLFVKDDVIGGMTVQSEIADYFTKQDLEIFRTLASLCSIAVHNNYKHQEIVKMKDLDGLTGAFNRHALINYNNKLDHQKKELRNLPLTIAMFDIDYFKTYNDKYGHIAGDQCLIKIVQGINKVVAVHSGKLFRYGGDEFAVVVEGMDINEAQIMFDEIMDIVRGMNIKHEYELSHKRRVTISLGSIVITEYIEPNKDYYEKVDVLLYDVKKNNRDNYLIEVVE